jgi:type IV secretory pathway VirB4 component
VESLVNCEAVFESFSAPRVVMRSEVVAQFHLVRRKADGTVIVEVSPFWSRFSSNLLAEFREKLQTEFHMELQSFNLDEVPDDLQMC